MIEVHRSIDDRPIYINIDRIETVFEDREHVPTTTTIHLVGDNGIDCIKETPLEILRMVKNARWDRVL